MKFYDTKKRKQCNHFTTLTSWAAASNHWSCADHPCSPALERSALRAAGKMETDHPHDLEEQILFRKFVCLFVYFHKKLWKKKFLLLPPHTCVILSTSGSLQSSIISVAEKETNTSAWTRLAMEYKHNNMKKCISFQHIPSGQPTCLENF